jgi:hypothetical protein
VVDAQIDLHRDGVFKTFYVKTNTMRTPVYVDHGGDRVLPLNDCLQYSLVTRTGDCGQLLFLRDPSTRCEKIIGVHVAGNGVYGYSSFLSSEYI